MTKTRPILQRPSPSGSGASMLSGRGPSPSTPTAQSSQWSPSLFPQIDEFLGCGSSLSGTPSLSLSSSGSLELGSATELGVCDSVVLPGIKHSCSFLSFSESSGKGTKPCVSEQRHSCPLCSPPNSKEFLGISRIDSTISSHTAPTF